MDGEIPWRMRRAWRLLAVLFCLWLAAAWKLAPGDARAAGTFGPWQRVLQEGMWGQDVLQLQMALEELGLKAADPPGYFGPATRRALERLQKAVGLEADGVLGPGTARVLESLGVRYPYRVRPGDTLWSVARAFGSSMESLMDENGLSDTTLRPGQILYVPTVRRLYVPAATRLADLARRLGVAAQHLAELNGLQTRDTVAAGSEIWTPLPNIR